MDSTESGPDEIPEFGHDIAAWNLNEEKVFGKFHSWNWSDHTVNLWTDGANLLRGFPFWSLSAEEL
jgi:hypothetical protein